MDMFDPYAQAAVVAPPSKEADMFDPYAQPEPAAPAQPQVAFNPFEETPQPTSPPAAAPAQSAGFEHDFFTQGAPPPPPPQAAAASVRQATGSFDAPPQQRAPLEAAPAAAPTAPAASASASASASPSAAANSSAGASLFDDVSMHRQEPVGAAQERPSKPPPATAEAPWFGAALENVALDDGTMRQFLSRALPQSAGTLKMNIVRSKAAMMSSYASEFRAYVSLDGTPGWRNRGLRFVMCAKREPGLKQGLYTISMSETDIKQHQPTVGA